MAIKQIFAAFALLSAASTWAAAPVEVANSVYVEREIAEGAAGARVLEPATELRRGDKLVYVVSWKTAQGRSEHFTITNPLPRTVAYQHSANGREVVSVDGGRTWGKLDALRIRDGERRLHATPEDVTHVRWRVPAQLALAGSGTLTFSGIVR